MSLFLPTQLSLSLSCSLQLSDSQSSPLFLFFFLPLPPSLPPTGTMSLPWLGGCNLLQAAGQAERSPSYLDRGSPGKSYQREGVFKYSRNCSNHFSLSLWPPPLASKKKKKGPTLRSTNFLQSRPPLQRLSPPGFSRRPPSFPSVSSSSIQLILARGVGSGADSCMTRNVSLCKSLLPPRAVLA